MRQLGARPPEPPPVESDVEKSPEISPQEQFPAEERELVEVYRLERKPIGTKAVERSQEPMEADKADKHQDPPPETATPLPDLDPVPLPHERFAVEAREPVEVHRVEWSSMERDSVEAEPVARPQETAAVETRPEPLLEPAIPLPDPGPAPKSMPLEEERLRGAAPIGRWEEFHDFRHAASERGSRTHLELVPLRPGPSSTLLTADLEREHHSSFWTFAVLAIAALLAAGAILWSGSLRYRVRQQNAAMSALQQQNQKLAETLAQKNGDQKNGNQKSGEQTDSRSLQSGMDAPQNHAAAPQPATAPAEERKQPEKRQGVSAPPAIQQRSRVSARPTGSLYEHPPEIVPPYPTIYKSENAAVNAANSQPVPNAGTYHEPFVPGAPRQAVPAPASQRPATNADAASPPGPVVANTNNSAPASTSYDAASNDAGLGSHANMLAQNIEAVQRLQRHSPMQLTEFHTRAGTSTQATPNVRISVQHPDQGRGSYTLVVNGGGSSYQLRGEVNQPLAFTDTATHREYALVVMSIADQQVYGYVRAKQ